MNMQNLNGKRVLITGGSQGLGLAMVEALAACGANVIAIGRDRANLSSAEHAGAAVIAGDATDATLMNKVVREDVPDVLILNAGARLPIKPINQQNWDEFSTVWNTDVKAGLVGIQRTFIFITDSWKDAPTSMFWNGPVVKVTSSLEGTLLELP
jgi:NAD(P)-dependent dehydrogenase (short-subunit alcohol dehydrogenase family)